jgi:two-component system sensor histidine kinase KdpD
MSTGRLSALPLKGDRPSRPLGIVAAIACVAVATALIYPLKKVSPVVSLGVLYVPAVVLVSTLWGLRFGIATSLLSAAAYNFFHLPPGGRFDLADEREWVALVVFVAVAVLTGLVADLARVRGREAEQRRQEADLAAELAQLLLGTAELSEALQLAGEHLAVSLGVRQATIALGADQPVDGMLLFPLRNGRRDVGTLCLAGELSEAERERIAERVVPSLQSLLVAAVNRAELQASVVENEALRRSDELKTAVLRSVSHDLRTPLTAILMAATALDTERPSPEHVADVREQVLDAATRLGHLIEKLLDLSLLQAGRAEPRLEWYALDEVVHEAVEQCGAPPGAFKLSLDAELPLLRGDPAQLERAFANVLENAVRYSAGKPVSVRARAVGPRVRVLIADQGPGIPARERERIFLPFYRTQLGGAAHSGSGLGLAISKGFLELNGARIAVESSGGHGTTFVVELALPDEQPAAASVSPPPAASAPAEPAASVPAGPAARGA